MPNPNNQPKDIHEQTKDFKREGMEKNRPEAEREARPSAVSADKEQSRDKGNPETAKQTEMADEHRQQFFSKR